MSYKSLISILIFLLFTEIVLAQNNVYDFKNDRKISQFVVDNWSQEDGLPSNSLKSIYQTSDGYLWITSYSGLIRVSGNSFELFDKKRIPILLENGVGAMVEDKLGNLWISTQSSGLISYKNNKFTSHYTDSAFGQFFPVLFIDNKNQIWGASPLSGWFIFSKNKYKKVFKDAIEPSFFIQDKKNNIWIGTTGSGLVKKHNEDYITYSKKDGLLSNWINCIYIDKNNLFWIGTDEGLCFYDGEKFTSDSYFNQIDINSIVADKNNNIWIGTNYGLYLKRPQGGNYELLNDKNGLENNYINKLFIDKENSLWIINYKRGLSRLKSSKFICYTQTEGASGTVVNDICEISPSVLLIAYDNGKIDKLVNKNLEEYKIKSNLKEVRIRDIFKDTDNNIWLSTYEGILKISSDGKETWLNTKTGFPDNYIRSIFEDSKKNIWVGTRNAGVVRINKDNTFTVFDKHNGLNVNLIMSLNEDKDGNILVATSKGGLSIISDGKIKKTYTKSDGLIDDIIFNTYIDSLGIIWIAVNGGINSLKDGRIYSFPYKDSLLKDTPFDILEDNKGYFWMPCNSGIMKVKKAELIQYQKGKISSINCQLFDQYDGLKQSECNSTAKSLKMEDGSLWFPTLNGVAMIYPDNVSYNGYIPPVYIDNIFIDNKHYALDSAKEISSITKRITFTFTSLSYYNPNKNLFRYKLQGFEDQWSEPSKVNSISYTNLPPGEYTFKVIACNNDGIWNTKGDEFTFYINPKCYQTVIFYVFLLVIIILLLYLIWVLRIKHLKKKQIELEGIIYTRTSEILEKNEELLHQKEEIKLQAEELEKLSIVASETNNSVMIFDKNQKLVWVNNSYKRKYGEFKNGINISEVVSNQNIQLIIDKCALDKKSVTFESKKITENGNIVWVQISLTPIFEQKKINKIIVIETDITEIKKAQFELTLQKKYITSSLNSAKAIQKTVFPTKDLMNKYFETLIFFKPKDIVSGDFYWFSEIPIKKLGLNQNQDLEQKKLINCNLLALVDCTGHGVPGAFMSILAHGLLNEIVNLKKIYDPKEILKNLNQEVIKILKQEKSENLEGMDISLCLIKKFEDETLEVLFSGAKHSAFHYKKSLNKVFVTKGNRKSIGGVFYKNENIEFDNKIIYIEKEDLLYLTTDGIIDQNNIERRRFGTPRFQELISNIALKPIDEQLEIFKNELHNWQQDEIQRDDISVIGIKF